MKYKEIVMIDYGASNLRSAQKAFEHVGAEVKLTADPQTVRQANRLVLPGVGAFGAGSLVHPAGYDEVSIPPRRWKPPDPGTAFPSGRIRR